MANYGKVLGALVVGAAAGAALGVLFAPDKGSETRKRIVKGTNSLIDQLNDKIEEGKSALSDLRRKTNETVHEMGTKVGGSSMESDERNRRTRTTM
jgi:gas vesicle protein